MNQSAQGAFAVDSGLVLPLPSVGLLGAGPAGAHALTQFGIASRDFDGDLADLLERLAGDPDTVAMKRLAESIVAVAAHAFAWVSIRSDHPDVAPLIALLAPGATLAACLHGEVVEWVHGDSELPVALLTAAAASSVDHPVVLTLFADGVSIAGLLLRGSEVDVAAKDDDRLQRITAGASVGLPGLWRALLAEVAPTLAMEQQGGPAAALGDPIA